MFMKAAGFAAGGCKTTVSAFHGLPITLSIVSLGMGDPQVSLPCRNYTPSASEEEITEWQNG